MTQLLANLPMYAFNSRRVLLAVLMLVLSGSALAAAQCPQQASLQGMSSSGWGIDPHNRRFQADATITAANVADLELAWAFGLDESTSPHSYPLVTEDTVFIGSESGRLYALDRDTGCTRWVFESDGNIRTAIVHGTLTLDGEERTLLFFGTFGARAYAVDASSGALVWEKLMDGHRFSTLTGTPVFHDGRLYVPVSAYEVIAAVAPMYGCCSFRGSVAALDAATGEEIWRRYTIEEEAAVTDTRWLFIEKKGPSGAPVWQAPVVDARRGLLYFATGENYSDPPTDTSDAVFAVALSDGSVRWHHQFTEGDAWNAACGAGWLDGNCPEADGPDYDFGAPPILARTPYGRELLYAGQKSSMVYAMEPGTGELVWQQRVGRGGKLGGIHWGMAVNEKLGLLYVPVSDRGGAGPHEGDNATARGLHALSLQDGSVRWSVPEPGNCEGREGCFPGISAAILATDDLVIGGGLDGGLSAYAADSGERLWYYDTWKAYEAVNGLETEGGPLDVHGPLIVGDMLFITSGYQSFGQKGGNAFLAFRLPRPDALPGR
jgi:polyvinyl alcohol dehydrogenase (cytochrome)